MSPMTQSRGYCLTYRVAILDDAFGILHNGVQMGVLFR
jgi:hypothetical protein